MQLPKLQFSAQLDDVRAKKDRTLSLRIGTQEMHPDDSAYLLDLFGKHIYIAIAETAIEKIDVPEIVPDLDEEKSPAQRLRGVLFVLWQTKTDQKIPFPTYYRDYLEKIIEKLKEKLA